MVDYYIVYELERFQYERIYVWGIIGYACHYMQHLAELINFLYVVRKYIQGIGVDNIVSQLIYTGLLQRGRVILSSDGQGLLLVGEVSFPSDITAS